MVEQTRYGEEDVDLAYGRRGLVWPSGNSRAPAVVHNNWTIADVIGFAVKIYTLAFQVLALRTLERRMARAVPTLRWTVPGLATRPRGVRRGLNAVSRPAVLSILLRLRHRSDRQPDPRVPVLFKAMTLMVTTVVAVRDQRNGVDQCAALGALGA